MTEQVLELGNTWSSFTFLHSQSHLICSSNQPTGKRHPLYAQKEEKSFKIFFAIRTGLQCEAQAEFIIPFPGCSMPIPSNNAADPFCVISGDIINT